ncbi:hypothetical protein KIN20_024805 [Parelaphostrongylus tenuis]|uniref:Uncharacterized protein n=1 Tax=Parelaphostrongylus tenuis TaxID=148309 RepID=A0AAD5NBF5_PARTN|nr:hypothetical protein KIN20_024805 [Parelaphostrongylus tenuis]
MLLTREVWDCTWSGVMSAAFVPQYPDSWYCAEKALDSVKTEAVVESSDNQDVPTRCVAILRTGWINQHEGAGTATKSTMGRWFKKIREGNFVFEDVLRPNQPSLLNESDWQRFLDAGPRSSTRDLTEELGVSQRIDFNKFNNLILFTKSLARFRMCFIRIWLLSNNATLSK